MPRTPAAHKIMAISVKFYAAAADGDDDDDGR